MYAHTSPESSSSLGPVRVGDAVQDIVVSIAEEKVCQRCAPTDVRAHLRLHSSFDGIQRKLLPSATASDPRVDPYSYRGKRTQYTACAASNESSVAFDPYPGLVRQGHQLGRHVINSSTVGSARIRPL